MKRLLPTLLAVLTMSSCLSSHGPQAKQVFYRTHTGDHYEVTRWHQAVTPNIDHALDHTPGLFEWYSVEPIGRGRSKVHRQYWSPSLDWHVTADYFYDRKGRLRKVEREYATHLGFVAATGAVLPTIVDSTLHYAKDGTLKKTETTVLSGEDRTPVQATYPPNNPKPWLTLADLPKPTP